MSNLKVYSVTSIAKMKSNLHYENAKGGDFDEAMELIDDLNVDEKFPIEESEILVPVLAQEQKGRNKIPLALTVYLAQTYGNSMELNILQSARSHHTGAGAVDRLKKVPFIKLEDAPLHGQKFVIVDDHVTMGCTVASLAKFIRENGGTVEKVFSISNSIRSIKVYSSQDLTPASHEIDEVRKKFGDWVEKQLGFAYEEMTRPMIQYLLRFKDIANMQKRFKSITASANLLSMEELEALWAEFTIDALSAVLRK